VITTLHNPFYSELAQDIINRSEELGYHVFTSSVYGKTKGEYEAVEGLISRGVDGLIICSALRKDPVIEGLLKHKLPFILAMRKTDIKPNDRPIDCIEIDNELGGYIAMDHLLNLGHERIGLLTGPIITSTGYYRRVGALSACKKKKIGLRKITVIEGDFNRESGRKLSRELLFGKHKPTAIFAGNDHMAIGVMDTLLDLGIKCPQDIALVGFDDIEMAGLPGVGLTTVSQKKSLMGSLAVDQLMEQIKLKDQYLFKRKILEPQLVIRKSCGYYNR
jgi:DNA-binding LacI/PurR family transcriptional regulator